MGLILTVTHTTGQYWVGLLLTSIGPACDCFRDAKECRHAVFNPENSRDPVPFCRRDRIRPDSPRADHVGSTAAVPTGSARSRAVRFVFETRQSAGLDEALSARPHHVGRRMEGQCGLHRGTLQVWGGLRNGDRAFDVLFPSQTRLLEMTAPERFRGSSKTAAQGRFDIGAEERATPVYNAYSINGDVTGQLDLRKLCIPQDYEELTGAHRVKADWIARMAGRGAV